MAKANLSDKPIVPAKVYHGTSSKNLAGIEKKGLVPKEPSVKKWKPLRAVKRGAYVSFADLTSAVCWAKEDVKHKGGKPMVLELNTSELDIKLKFLRVPMVYCKGKLRWHPEFGSKKQIPFEALKVIDVTKKCKEAKLRKNGKKSPYCP